ncbi:hypothetical protein JCM10212_004632 [Sporobolomyces blumeae]
MQSASLPRPDSTTTTTPRLSLSPTVSPSTGFKFPSLYSFPPFFTKQPNLATWHHQRLQWTQLILSWSKHTRTSRIDLSNESVTSLELFHNAHLDRHLPLPVLVEVLTSMSTSSPPTAELDPAPSSSARALSTKSPVVLPRAAWVWWKRPDEWADTIYDWVKETGQQNSIMTFYELIEGDAVRDLEFYHLPEPILRRALDILAKQGKASLLRGLGEDGDGVKFV